MEAMVLNGAAKPNGAAPLNGSRSYSAASAEEQGGVLESRPASGAAASTSAEAQSSSKRTATQVNGTASSSCERPQQQAVAALALSLPAGQNGSCASSAEGTPVDAELAATIAEIQERRCPPLGRFGHGTAYNVRVTKRARAVPFSIKARGLASPCARTPYIYICSLYLS